MFMRVPQVSGAMYISKKRHRVIARDTGREVGSRHKISRPLELRPELSGTEN